MKPQFRLKLFPKFVLVMVLLSILPLVIVGIQLININRTTLEINILEHHRYLAKSLAEKIDNYLETLDSKLWFLIKSQLTRDISLAERQIILQSLVDANPDTLVNVSIVAPDGSELLKVFNPDKESNPVLVDHRKEPLFRDAVKENRSRFGEVYYQQETNDPRMKIVYPFFKGHFIYLTLTLNKLWAEVLNTQIGKTGYAYVVDHKGQVVVHPDKDKTLAHTSLANLPIVQEVLSRQVVGSRQFVDENKNQIIGAYYFVRRAGWGVIVQQTVKEAFFAVDQMRFQAILWIGVFLVLSSLIAFFLARSLTLPILELIKGASRVAQGNFTHQVTVQTSDELSDLTHTFNEMVTKLQEYADIQLDKLLIEKTKTEAIVFSIKDGIILSDLNGQIMLLNKQAREMFSIPDEGWEEKLLTDCLPEFGKEIISAVSHNQQNFFKEISFPTAIGRQIYFHVSAQPVRTLKGGNLGVLVVFHDITLEKELDQMKDDFVHSITHDLRNPMTSIRGFLKFLIDGVGGPITEQQKKILQVMDRASIRLLGMINDILDVAKMESGKMIIYINPVNLLEIIPRVIEIQQPLADRKKIILGTIVSETPMIINVDANLIERVFMNLVGNAVKFTPEGGKVTIGLEEHPTYFDCWIQDTGEGILPEYLDRVFDKFQQAGSRQSRGGSGLGLTVCKYIVEGHHGKIWVESKIGEGSKFMFRLPKNLAQTEEGEVICPTPIV